MESEKPGGTAGGDPGQGVSPPAPPAAPAEGEAVPPGEPGTAVLGGTVPPSRRVRARRLRLYGWLVAITAALLAGGGIMWGTGTPTEAELREQAGLLDKENLRIGVKDDTPGIAVRDKETDTFKGFDIDIAYMIANDLGFQQSQVEFLSIETEDRARMRAQDKNDAFVSVDLVVATFSVTDERRKDTSVGFSSPYMRTEQSVVTKSGHAPVTSLQQLRDKQVCTLGTSTSQNELERAGARLTGVNRIKQCIDGLYAGTYEAVSTDAAILAGFVTASAGRLRHWDVGVEKSEHWAVNTGTNEALRRLVELSLYRSLADPADRRWEKAYDTHILPMASTNQGIDIAGDIQPCLVAPDVRRWPWERDLPRPQCRLDQEWAPGG
ncbi:transporter substrate-binding domain-containing protein [Spongiactinospora sp. TRM90649]|uniref:transporter substrate-binding domain-containing protein n=1 Tax=Spongiactinospora sp. TRM90649 TaxID=3031114 RepID=UPI0023F971D3|nr:transporter substrate-binding domain-containing protein [Spongiactinospora sp. TRM90649]MDF5754132.1 transporter substrate-binding domain-containing protein [Spongiactinospora sp. TRM90649]